MVCAFTDTALTLLAGNGKSTWTIINTHYLYRKFFLAAGGVKRSSANLLIHVDIVSEMDTWPVKAVTFIPKDPLLE